jgi:hypothetical protein
MQPSIHVHRNVDGTIDYDFYRRRAVRQRRLTRRRLIHGWSGTIACLPRRILKAAKASCLASRQSQTTMPGPTRSA